MKRGLHGRFQPLALLSVAGNVRLGSPRIPPQTLPLIGVGVAMVTAAIVLGYDERGQTLKGDEWDYAIRLSAQPLGHALLQPPPDKYLMAVPLLLYKGLFETVGIDSYTPYRVVQIALVILCGSLFFTLARRRVGDLLAVPPTILLLFFGSASEVVVTPLRIPSLIAIAAGLGTLITLERRSLQSDLTACLLLAISLASHPESVAFAASAMVLVLLRPAPGRWRRSWVFVAPVALFGIWSVWNGQSGGTNPAFDRLSHLPSFAADSFVSTTAAVTGASGLIDGPAFDDALGWIAAGLVVVLVALALILRPKPLTPRFWALLAALVVMLGSTALAPVSAFRTPETARYLYPEAILLLLLLAELASGLQLSRPMAWIAAVVVAAGLVSNLADLQRDATNLRVVSDVVKAQLGAVDLERGRVDPDFLPLLPPILARAGPVQLGTAPGAGGQGWLMRASEYFRIARDFESPAYSPEELARRPLETRHAADAVLVRALGLRLEPAPLRPTSGPMPTVANLARGAAKTTRSCVDLSPRDGGVQAEVSVPPGGVWLSGTLDSEDQFGIARFSELPTALQRLRRGRAAYLTIPRDGLPIPWRLSVLSTRRLRVCGLRGA
jgi:hypothetical protein